MSFQPLPLKVRTLMSPVAQSGVYTITNSVTGKVYVGSAQKFNVRWAAHLRRLRKGTHHSWKLQRDFDLFGESAFNFRPLLVCEVKDLALFEQRALTAYDAVASGYNVSSDVEAPFRGRKHSEETKEKMRAASTGNSYAVGSKSRTGQTNSEEHRRKCSEAQKGREQDPEFVERRVAPLRGRKGEHTHTEETKARLSEIHKEIQSQRTIQPFAGKAHTDETKRKMSEARKGRPKSDEWKRKMSEIRRAKKQGTNLTSSPATSESLCEAVASVSPSTAVTKE